MFINVIHLLETTSFQVFDDFKWNRPLNDLGGHEVMPLVIQVYMYICKTKLLF